MTSIVRYSLRLLLDLGSSSAPPQQDAATLQGFECQCDNDKLNPQGVNISDRLEIRVRGRGRVSRGRPPASHPHTSVRTTSSTPLTPQMSPSYFCLSLHLSCKLQVRRAEQTEPGLNCSDREPESEGRKDRGDGAGRGNEALQRYNCQQ